MLLCYDVDRNHLEFGAFGSFLFFLLCLDIFSPTKQRISISKEVIWCKYDHRWRNEVLKVEREFCARFICQYC